MPKKKHATRTAEKITKNPSFWQRVVKHLGVFTLNSSTPEILLIAYLCLGRAVVNPDFSYPSEIILNIVLLGMFATAFYFLYRKLLLRRFGLGAVHIAALLTAYQLYAFSYAYKTMTKIILSVTPNLTFFGRSLVILIVCSMVFACFAALVGWVLRRFLPDAELPLLKIAVFTIGFIFATQFIKVASLTWDFRKALTYKQPSVSYRQDVKKITSKPNIYYLVLDRYADKQTLQTVYGYDDTPTLDYLESLGMYNRQNAHSNYPFTMQSIGSTLRMDYHTDLGKQFPYKENTMQAGFPYRAFLDNPPIVAELKKNGYRYNVVSSWWDFTRKSPAADNEPTGSYRLRILGKTFWASDLQRDIINKSILSPFLLKGVSVDKTPIIKYDLDRNPEANFADQMSALKTIADNAPNDTQPHITFSHILSPHDPYVFLPDGSKAQYDGNRTDNGEDEFIKYTNQLRYVNDQMKLLVSHIREKDPNAVIVLQADEGPYPKEFRGNQTAQKYHTPLMLNDEKMAQKFGTFASYYFPGMNNEETATEMTSHVNVFRFVLRHYLGYDLPNLPDCHIAVGAKFNLYGFKDVTKTVSPNSTDQCSAI